MKVSFYLAYKNLIEHKKLFFLLTGILIFSFVNLTFFDAITHGVEQATNNQLRNYVFADFKILPKNGEDFIQNTHNIMNKVEKLPEVQSVAPRIIISGIISDGKHKSLVPITGVSVKDESFVSLYEKAIKKGTFLTNNPKGIVLGDELVGNLDGSKPATDFETLDLKIGNKATIEFSNGIKKEYKVLGIHDTLFWIPDFKLLMQINELKRILGEEGKDISSEILVKLYDKNDKDKVKNELINLGINQRVVDGIKELALSETILKGQKTTTYLGNIIGIFSTFITVFIVIFINVSNSKKQLGILKAIGIDENKIINSYIILSFLYAIAGIFFGLITLYLVCFYIKLNPIKLPVGYFYPIVGKKEIITGSIILIVSSVISGYFASYKIIKTNIVDVLRGN